MYAYGRAPVAGPGPQMDIAATAGWRVESVGGGEVGVGLPGIWLQLVRWRNVQH